MRYGSATNDLLCDDQRFSAIVIDSVEENPSAGIWPRMPMRPPAAPRRPFGRQMLTVAHNDLERFAFATAWWTCALVGALCAIAERAAAVVVAIAIAAIIASTVQQISSGRPIRTNSTIPGA